jgi:hypothetical protein
MVNATHHDSDEVRSGEDRRGEYGSEEQGSLERLVDEALDEKECVGEHGSSFPRLGGFSPYRSIRQAGFAPEPDGILGPSRRPRAGSVPGKS